MVEHLNEETFKEKIFDYTSDKEFKFKGKLPALIDFYADWCGPCKMVSPVIEELAQEYAGKIDIYKINTEVEQKLAAMFGIKSIPSLLFMPVGGDPQMARGAMTKAQFEKAFSDIFSITVPHPDESVPQGHGHSNVANPDNFVDTYEDTTDESLPGGENKDINPIDESLNEQAPSAQEQEEMKKENFIKGYAD